MFAYDHKQRDWFPLMPGLLDDSLLSRGSFSFQVPLVKFDKLKVLGNVYVNRVNGRPLRQSYLFKSPQPQEQQQQRLPKNFAPSNAAKQDEVRRATHKRQQEAADAATTAPPEAPRTPPTKIAPEAAAEGGKLETRESGGKEGEMHLQTGA